MEEPEKKFQNLPHTADLKLEIFGKTKEKLFENAMIAMFKEAGFIGEEKSPKRRLRVEAVDISSLLVSFLSEILYLSEINDEVYWKVGFKSFTETEIVATLEGEKLKERGVIIKGVTFHDLSAKKKKDGTWIATVLFDV